ncbi:hypothetical protein QBC45DRAFT_67125 [Copromyces sp. CBS 386.78]|nr:hypothetical protein QBC45DRAFT_67125 [Copromyces sp. CBS 386.78]
MSPSHVDPFRPSLPSARAAGRQYQNLSCASDVMRDGLFSWVTAYHLSRSGTHHVGRGRVGGSPDEHQRNDRRVSPSYSSSLDRSHHDPDQQRIRSRSSKRLGFRGFMLALAARRRCVGGAPRPIHIVDMLSPVPHPGLTTHPWALADHVYKHTVKLVPDVDVQRWCIAFASDRKWSANRLALPVGMSCFAYPAGIIDISLRHISSNLSCILHHRIVHLKLPRFPSRAPFSFPGTGC